MGDDDKYDKRRKQNQRRQVMAGVALALGCFGLWLLTSSNRNFFGLKSKEHGGKFQGGSQRLKQKVLLRNMYNKDDEELEADTPDMPGMMLNDRHKKLLDRVHKERYAEMDRHSGSRRGGLDSSFDRKNILMQKLKERHGGLNDKLQDFKEKHERILQGAVENQNKQPGLDNIAKSIEMQAAALKEHLANKQQA
jgi:hypothetical protein